MKRYNFKYTEQDYSSLSSEELLKIYFDIKSQPFLSPEDMKKIRLLMPYMYERGIDVESLNIREYKKQKNKKQYILKKSKRVSPFNRGRV